MHGKSLPISSVKWSEKTPPKLETYDIRLRVYSNVEPGCRKSKIRTMSAIISISDSQLIEFLEFELSVD